MLDIQFFNGKENPKILCLGAHPDDIEIGCGGAVLKLITEIPKIQFYWVVFSGNKERAREARQSASVFLTDAFSKTIKVQQYRESYFPFIGAEIKDFFEEMRKEFSPDLIFTHYMNDAHQDHRLLANLTWNTFRNHFILEYEIPKYDGDLGTPNLYFHLDESVVRKKVGFVCDIFKSQKAKGWFSEETFKSILRIRGIESNSPSKYAEAFYCRKIVF
jgi:LmbE family N-acetylglucosaminyl deacetylase